MLNILQYEYEIITPNHEFIFPYYIVFSDGGRDWADNGTAHCLNMRYSTYLVTLVEKFNACHYDNGRILFYNIEDAKQALEWLESIYIATKLIK